LARQLSSLLISYKNLLDVSHFGAEISAQAQETLKIGKQLMIYFTQPLNVTISHEINQFVIAHLMHGTWRTMSDVELPQTIKGIINKTVTDQTYKSLITTTVNKSNTIADILAAQIPLT
jgi:F0F1-type ATP synthase alpha subunit